MSIDIKDVRLRLTSTRAVLFSNVRLSNPLDPIVKEMKSISGKTAKSKTEDDLIALAKLEWKGGWYWNDDPDSGLPVGPVLPTVNVFRSFVGAARQTRDGKKVERGVTPVDLETPLLYDGPRDHAGLWGEGLSGSPYVDFRPVAVNGGKKIQRCRPRLPAWEAVVDFKIDTRVLDMQDFLDIADRAGANEGVGDYRLMFGRYTVEVI